MADLLPTVVSADTSLTAGWLVEIAIGNSEDLENVLLWNTGVWDTNVWSGPIDGDGYFVDATGLTRSIKTSIGRHRFTARFRAGTASFELSNDTGVLTPPASVAPPLGLLPMQPGMAVRLTKDGGAVWYGYIDTMTDVQTGDGMIVSVVKCIDEIGLLQRNKQLATIETGSGDNLRKRLERIVAKYAPDLNVSRWMPGTNIMTFQPTTFSGDAATQMHIAADSEGGAVFMGPKGDNVRYVTNDGFQNRMEEPAKWVVGGSAPIKVLNVTSTYSSQYVINEAHFARRGGVEQIAAVPAKHVRTHTRLDLENDDDDQVLFLASQLVNVASVDRQRVTGCTIQPERGSQAELMGIEARIGDKVQLTVDTMFGWSYTVVTQIFGISHQVDDEVWQVVYRLDDTLFDGENAAFSDGFSDGFN